MAVTNTPDKSEMLLPCPFCGGDDIDGNDEVVRCHKCGAEQPYLSLDHDATERWNTRAPSRPPADQVPELVEELRFARNVIVGGMHNCQLRTDAIERLDAALQAVPAASEVGEELGCDYCNNDGPLIEQSGWAPRCPRCDAEYPTLKASGEE